MGNTENSQLKFYPYNNSHKDQPLGKNIRLVTRLMVCTYSVKHIFSAIHAQTNISIEKGENVSNADVVEECIEKESQDAVVGIDYQYF